MKIEELKALANAYRKVFGGPVGEQVRADLEKFGLEMQTSFDSDPLKMARNEGRRQFWLHIKNLLVMDISKLEELNKTKQEPEENEEDE